MSTASASFEHPVTRCVATIAAALDEVASCEPLYMDVQAKGAALIDLSRLSSQLEGLRMRVMAGAGDVADRDACRNVSSWLGPRTLTEYAPNGAAERLATDLDSRWQLVGAGLLQGRVNLDQARVIVRSLNAIDLDNVDPELLRGAEAHLVAAAAEFTPAQLKRLGDKVLEVLDPETYEDEERKRLERELRKAEADTRLWFRRRGDGSTDISARVPDSVASRLKTLLNAHTSPRHDANTPGAPTHIDPATGQRLPHDRLQGLAFCALLEALDPNRLPSQGGSATTCVVTMNLADLQAGVGTASLADGTRIPVGEFRRLACNAGIIPAVLGGRSEVLDMGRLKRLFSGAMRRAMGVEHPTCRAEYCTIPADWCEAHHWRQPWAKGGKTDLADGKLLCPWHHQRAHDESYQVEHLPNGDVRFHKRR